MVGKTALIKACGASPSLVGHVHAAVKTTIWGLRHMKPYAAAFVTMSRQLTGSARLYDALYVYCSTLACAKQVSQLCRLLYPALLMSSPMP